MDSPTAVVAALATGRKAAQLYPYQHPAFIEAIDDLTMAADEATRTGVLTLNIHQGRLYHQSAVISEDAAGVSAMRDALDERRIESISLHPGFTSADAVGLVEVLGLKATSDLDVEAELASRGVTAVTIALLADDEEREERDRIREQDRALYRRLVAALRTVSTQVDEGTAADLEGASEIVGGILGRLLEDRSAMLGLATMQGRTEADLFHSINVMIYTMALGATLGIPEEGLSSLGLSALVHDIGKAAFDREDPEQAEACRLMHPTVGAEILSSVTSEDPAPMLVAYEHHMGVDGSGYPDREAGYVSHPFARMVGITNRYVNLVAPDTGVDALTPDKAIARILREAESELDPMFARLFVKAMGVFPVGCLVRLSDQSVGVVCSVGDRALTPIVRVIYDERGFEIDEPAEVDTATADLAIVEVVDPASLAATVSDHL